MTGHLMDLFMGRNVINGYFNNWLAVKNKYLESAGTGDKKSLYASSAL